MQHISSLSPGSGDRVQPRSHLASDAARLDLSGAWRFRWSPRADSFSDDVAAVDFDDSGFDQIEVPSHWVLQGDGRYGRPAYLNITYPFPVDVPHVPDENPTGDYRLRFTVEEGFVPAGGRAYLRTLGIESLAIVHLNGVEVGEIRGSRLQQELDVTDALLAGENVLHIRVHQWSAATYLEDQDQWWLPGIFREVEIVARPAGGIEDVWLRTDFDPGTHDGTVLPEVRGAAFPVRLDIPELGVHEVFDSAEDVAAVAVGRVEPWSADVPRLYDASVSNSSESISLRLGFRRVEIVGHEWRVNGRKLRIRGTNRHDFHPDKGRVFDAEDARRQLLLMKQHNINAIRTSHAPCHPELLEMTDELGFWVMLENDLETHGFEEQGWRGNPSDDPRWHEAFLDRIQRTFERDKNHPSIVCWSLGNESGRGTNLAAMASWLRHRDPGRPVHYEADFDGAHTDIVSRMYVPIEQMRLMSSGEGDALASPGRAAVLAQRPMILCEYVHAMGNGPGGITEYEEAFDSLPQWHGGFFWEWRDHGLRTALPDGREFFAYGGDFGEPVHDGSFICDGMVLSDGTPTPGLAEYKAVVAPIKLGVGRAELVVENRRHDGDTSDLRFVLVDEVDGHVVKQTVLDVPVLAAGATVSVALPEPDPCGGELWRTVRAELADDVSWAAAGHEVAFCQVCLQQPSSGTAPGVRVVPARRDRSWTLGPAEFDPRTGDLQRLGALPIRGPRLTLWRAPMENDLGEDFGSYLDVGPAESAGLGQVGPSTAARWLSAGLDRLQRRVRSVTVENDVLVVRHRYAAAGAEDGVDVTLRYSGDGSTLRLDADSAPTSGWRGVWARLGLHFELPPEGETAEWFGTGPLENYPDLRRAAKVGRFQCAIDDLVVAYAKPQESGHRAGLRELRVPELGLELGARPVGGELPGFTLRRHDEHEVAAASHPHELPAPSKLHLHVDVAQHGSGSRTCGPDVLPQYQLRPRAGVWSLRLRHVPRR